MKLLTEVKLPEYPFRIDHHSGTLLLGSCFTDNIGRLLKRSKFPVTINPFGVTYNPASLSRQLEALMSREAYVIEDLNFHNGKWFSFDHYTGFSSDNKQACLDGINQAFTQAKEELQKASLLVITWGTSWVYRYKTSGQVVCNCHKIPADQFTRTRLSVREIVKIYSALLPELFKYKPEIKVLFTISPIRHWKDGAHGNQLSKAALLLAADALEDEFPGKVNYFPSYEITMDEMRDYRYYADDMLHLSSLAVEYIWEKFQNSLVSEESLQIMRDLEPLIRMEEHRSLNKSSEVQKETIRIREEKRAKLQKRYPFLSL